MGKSAKKDGKKRKAESQHISDSDNNSVGNNSSLMSSIINGYRQFGGHKNRENKSLKIEFYFLIVCFGLFWVFIHVRLTIQRIRIFALVDKMLFIYLMQNFRSFTYLMLRGVQRTLEELLNTPVRTGIKYL